MPILNTGQIFSSGDQVTSQKLKDIADLATFSEPADGVTIIVNNENYDIPAGDGKLKVPANGISGNELLKDATDDNNRAVTTDHIKDSNVTTAKIADSAVEFAKIQNISTAKVLGRTATGAGVVGEVDILDENDLISNSNIALATQSSIKAYVESYVANSSRSYSTGWVSLGANADSSAENFIHNLGTTDVSYTIYVSPHSNGSDAVVLGGPGGTITTKRGVQIQSVTDNSFTVQMGASGYVTLNSSGNQVANSFDNKYMKIVVIG
jgi:hypothetical protein